MMFTPWLPLSHRRRGIKGLLREPLLFLAVRMRRIAVFVDAGYLLTQGSLAVTGERQARNLLLLNTGMVVDALRAHAVACSPRCELLRIYWYDGSIGGNRPTTEQAALAATDDVKLRLGFVNSHGQQKGVDSLIVTDLIELARLKSISDALLISGDEDVRVGVQIAQSYGVRLHLLGIHPARGSQSLQLMQEADTTAEWSPDTVRTFLTVRPVFVADPAQMPNEGEKEILGIEEALTQAVAGFSESLTAEENNALREFWNTGNRGIPADIDGRLLATCRNAIGRHLEPREIRTMRARFRAAIAGQPMERRETPIREN